MIRKILMAFTLLLISGQALAQGTQTFTKTLLTPQNIQRGDPVNYRFDFSCSSLTADCGMLSITDTLPPDLELVTCPVALGFTIMCAGNTVDIVKDTTFLDGDIFALSLNARARVEATQGVPIVNMATSTITLGPGGNPDMTTDSADPVTVEDPNANYIVRKTRTSPADPLLPAADTDIEYRVSLCAVSGIDNTDLNSAMLVDTYTPGATVVFTDGGIDNGTTITWDLGDIDLTALYAGQNANSEQCVSRNVVLFFPSGAFPLTTPIPNTVMGSGIPAEGPGTGFPPGNETATVPDVISPPTPGVNISKSADDVLGGPGGGPLNWGLTANINGSNVPVTDLTIYESIPQTPAGSFPLDFTSGQWNSPSNSQGTSQVVATISTSTTPIAASNSTDCALVAAYDPPLATAIVSPGSPITFPLVGNETCIRWEFSDISALPSAPAVPRGWQFTSSPRFRLDTGAVAGPYPISVENCLVGSFNDGGLQTDGPSCSSANIEDPTPAINASKNRLSPAGNVQPGQDVQYRLTFTHVNSSSTGPTFDPIITDLLPPEMEFVSWDAYNFGGGAQPPPNLEVIPNFAGSGRTLLRFSWATPALPGSLQIDGSPGMDNSASFDESIADGDMPQMEITVRVLDGTPPGNFTNELAFFDFSPIAPTCNSTGNEGGLFDLNDNGMNMDDYCSGTDGVTVIQAAVLGGQKFVRGDMDPTRPNVDDPTIDPMVVDSFCEGAPNGFTRFPCVAQTDHDGQFEYEIRLVNSGNVPLTDYILYDVLPDVGDTGVGPALQGSMRDSTWRPVINGPVAFLNGFLIDGITPFNPAFTVDYTTAANPCRNELSDTPPFPAGCSNTYQPFGAIADPTTITGFRIQIAYPGPQFWPAGATVNFMVPMDAPPDAPSSIPGNASFFNPAWNSFGHRATDQIPGIRLPAAEPRKVGIILPPAYRLGNLVWFDANRNGLAESGEPGIANVMVEARMDDDGTAGPSAGDTVADSQMTDANGKYLFSNLDAGTYYVLIPAGQDGAGLPLEDLLQTDVGEEATPDSDGDNNDNGVIVVAGLGLASGNVTLGPLDVEPTNEVDRVGGPDDDNDLYPDALSNVTVDFGYWRPFSLGNRVWLDDGTGTPMGSGFNNGLREATEMGIDGITVNLLDGSGAAFDTDPLTPGTQNSTTTANGGYYLFDNLPAGNFRVELDLTGGFENLESSTGANGNVNMFEPGANPENGTDDDDNGTRVDTMTIRSAVVTLGTVDMPNEPVMEADLDTSLANPQGTDSDGNPIPDIQGNMTVDFGLFETYSLGNRVWFDENNSGTIDGEAGIDGVTVRIFEDFNTDTVPDGPEIATDTTAGGGYYRFDNLRTGDYIVEVVIPAGTRSSDPDAGDPDADVDEDDDNGVVVDLIAGTVRANPVTLGPMGSEPVADNEDGPGDPGTVDDHSNLTVDFGFVPIYSLGNRVWLDDDNSGDINGEAGIDGIIVNLYLDNNDDGTPDGGVIDTTVTANGGYYRFDNLLADTYIVESAIPVNLYSSTPDAGDPDVDADDSDDNGVIVLPGFVRSNPVTLGPGTVEPTLEPDLGPGDQGSIDARANMTVDFGFTPPVSIGSTVFLDPENNGVQDGGGTNPGIANVTVELWSTGADGMIGGGDDSMAGMQLTSGAGDYFFDNLVPGNYYVQLPASNFGVGQPLEFIRLSSVPTSAADDQTDGDDNGTQAGGIGTLIQSAVINLNVGQEVDDTVETFQGGTQDNAAIASEDSGDMTIDFGLIPVVDVVAIGSTVFEDPNNSGTQDGGEMGIPNVAVELYGPGPDGLKGGGDDVFMTMTMTDANGDYLFDNLPEADYYVSIPVSNFTAGQPLDVLSTSSGPTTLLDNGVDADDNGDQPGGDSTMTMSVLITLTIDMEPVDGVTETGQGNLQDNADDDNGDMTVDFGFVDPATLVSIGSTVFEDPDDSGDQNPGEMGLPNISLDLYSTGPDNVIGGGDDVFIRSDVTDANGDYLFDALNPGNYYIEIPTKPGFAPLSSTPPHTMDDQVDGDDNGDQPGGANTLIRSPVINLAVGAEPTNGTTETQQGNLQDDLFDANGDMTVDFGLIPLGELVSIGSTVFIDPNNNGFQDGGELGIANVIVELWVPGGDGMIGGGDDVMLDSQPTSPAGDYFFNELAAGDYYVQIPVSNFMAGMALENIVLSSTPTNLMDDGADSDDNGDQPGGFATVVTSPLINLAANVEPTDGGTETGQGNGQDNAVDDDNGDMTVDFGFVPVSVADIVSVGSTVFTDLDNNGIQDVADVGIPGVTLELWSVGADMMIGGGDDFLVTQTMTDAMGDYLFANLPPAMYYIQLPTPPAGLPTSSIPTNLMDDGTDSDDNGDQPVGSGTLVISPKITLAPDTEPVDGGTETGQGNGQDNGDDNNGDMTIDFGFFDPATLVSLGSTVFEDPDNDGMQTGVEAGVPGVTVNLYDEGPDGVIGGGDDILVLTDTTDGMGVYYFESFPPGTYYVEIPVSNFAAGNPLNPIASSSTPTDVADNGEDEDDNGEQLGGPGTVVVSPIVNVAVGAEVSGGLEPGSGGMQDDAFDANGDMTIDFGFLTPVYDLALRKQLAVGQSPVVDTGDDVTFTISVFNQGNSLATQIMVTDYIPAGFILNDAAWTDNADGTASIVLPGVLQPDVMTPATVDITLQVTNAALAGDQANFAEISDFRDNNGQTVPDQDSTPDAMNDNDPGGAPNSPADDDIDGDGTGVVGGSDPLTDEDDHDPETVFVEVFDLSIDKALAAGQDQFVSFGQDVNFTITVTNEGNVDAANVTVIDYIPAGLQLNDPDWTDNGDDTASIVLPGILAAGTSTTVDITLVAVNVNVGGQVINRAEIESATDSGGGPRIDVDSDPGNDMDGEDDIDPEAVFLPPLIIPVNSPWALLLLIAGILLIVRYRLRAELTQRL